MLPTYWKMNDSVESFSDKTKVEKLMKKITLEEDTRNECEDVSTAVEVSLFTLIYKYKSEYKIIT